MKEIGNVDFILHLQLVSCRQKIDFPMEFVLDNVVGTANILDFARSLNEDKTRKVYLF